MPVHPCLGSACRAATTLDGVDGFEVPSWSAVTGGQRPPIMEVEDREPGVPRQGWQHATAIRIESSFRTEILMPRMSPVEQALLRSQSGSCAGVAFSVCPSSPLTRIDSALFRVLLQRRLQSPRSMFEDWGLGKEGLRSGECGHQSLQGSWGQSRDVRGSGEPRQGATTTDGVWSAEAKSFVGQLAKARRARSEPRVLQRRMEQAWRLRWCSILSCAAARSFAMSLLGLKGLVLMATHRCRMRWGVGLNPTVSFDTFVD